MLIYIFKSAACMAIFFVFYKFLLERENMHVFKRFYLLLAIGASLVIPALVFTEYVVVEPIEYSEIQQSAVSDYEYIGVPTALEKDVLDVEPILWTVYFLGFAFFGFRFIKNLFQIIRRVRKNPKQKATSFIQVLLKENFPPHTFFKYIFLNKKKLEANEIPKEVLLHEETHARQKHSLDVVLIEFLQVIFWFNPLVYLFKKAIKLNHEFLADQAVLDKDIDETTYQNTLLSYLSPDSEKKYQSQLANAINYSSIKKRFKVMKTHTSKGAILLRSLLLLPLLALLLLAFSETKLIETEADSSNEMIESLEQKRVTDEQLAQYNSLAKKYNKQPKETRVVPIKDLKILEDIYGKMTSKQKERALPFPECSTQDEIKKQFILDIDKSEIELNGRVIELNSFVKEVDVLTEPWEETDYTSITAMVNFRDTPKAFLKKVEKEFKKTHFSKANEGMNIFPPNYANKLQDGASRELMKEYNALAKKYNTMLAESKSIQIKMKDIKRLKYIYSQMSDKQKADAEPFPDFPDPPPAPKAPKEPKAIKATKIGKGEKSDIPPPPSTSNQSDRAFAEKVIGETIANQDPYDNSNQFSLSKKGEVVKLPTYSLPPETSRIKKGEKIEQNAWVVSSGTNRNSRMDEDGQPIPPVAPTIAIHANTDNHSKELNNAIQGYLKKNKAYEEAVDNYSKSGQGTRQDLWNTYNEAMKLYVNYYNLAQAEGSFVQPMPAYKKRSGEKGDIPSPPEPPTPKSPLDHIIEMAKKDAKFYYEEKEISSDQAIDLLKKNEALNIDSRGSRTKSPIVRISKQPISIEN